MEHNEGKKQQHLRVQMQPLMVQTVASNRFVPMLQDCRSKHAGTYLENFPQLIRVKVHCLIEVLHFWLDHDLHRRQTDRALDIGKLNRGARHSSNAIRLYLGHTYCCKT